ncbi:MAG: ferritin-like domain-containing protein [Caulobacteraceae bacterium]
MKDIEALMDEFLDCLPCKFDRPYPEVKVEEENPRYAKLLMDAYADGDKSEFTAIGQYLHHHFTIENKEIANAELCISLVEMKHLHILSDLITALGGNPKYRRSNKMWWSGGEVSYGDSACLKLKLDIAAEQAAIEGYEVLLSEIKDKHIQEIILRIIEDEKVHEQILTDLLDKYCRKNHG